LGEEILVLEGTFSDEHGNFGASTYFRNPLGSTRAPIAPIRLLPGTRIR